MSADRSKNTRALIVGLIALIVLVFLFWMFWNRGFNWYQHSYLQDDDQPYGADLTFKYLKKLRPDGEFSILDSTIAANLEPMLGDSASANYLVLGYLPYIDSLSKEHMFQFVSEGNSVFLMTGAVPASLLEEWNSGECLLYDDDIEYDFYYDQEYYDHTSASNYIDSLVKVNLIHPSLRNSKDYEFGHYVKDELKKYPWPYLDSAYFCADNESFTALGNINEHVNFFRVAYGDGYFYVHTNPKLLTNFYLLQDEGKAYADRVFAHLTDGPLIWDDKKWKTAMSQEYYKERYFQNEGPLSYLLSQESLRWMLYLLFVMAGIFFLLGSKRKQRAIPVLRPKENSSMEYVETISGLYFDQGGDGRIFRYLSDQFQFYVRKKYRLNFKWADKETWPMLAKASGLPMAHIQDIIAIHSKGSYEPNVDNTMLTEYYRLIDHFYSNCK